MFLEQKNKKTFFLLNSAQLRETKKEISDPSKEGHSMKSID